MQCGNYGNLLSLYFGKKFRETNVFTIEIAIEINSWFDERFFHIVLWCHNNSYFFLRRIQFHEKFTFTKLREQCHSVEKREILSHWKKISSNQLFSNFFSKTIAFTKFLRKKCEREFLQFPHCGEHNVEKTKIYCHKKYLVKSIYSTI